MRIFRHHLKWTRTLRTKALGVSKWESCLSVNWSISSQCIPIPALYISPLFSLSIYSTLHSQGTVQENQYVGMTNKTLGLSWKLTYPNSLSGFSCKSFIFSSLSHWTIDKNDWAWALIVDEKNESFFRLKESPTQYRGVQQKPLSRQGTHRDHESFDQN